MVLSESVYHTWAKLPMTREIELSAQGSHLQDNQCVSRERKHESQLTLLSKVTRVG
jgi:hypothetical protein